MKAAIAKKTGREKPFGQLFFLLPLAAIFNTGVQAQCIQAVIAQSSTSGIASVTAPNNSIDLSDGDITTSTTLTVSAVGSAILSVSFDKTANQGDSIVIYFGIPTANIADWGSLGSTTFTPFSGTNSTGAASATVTASNLSFILTAGANSLTRISVPITVAGGAMSVRVNFTGIGFALNKRVFIYDVAVKPGGPMVTAAKATVCINESLLLTATKSSALANTPIDFLWYNSSGTLVYTDVGKTGSPATSSYTAAGTNSSTTYTVRTRWNGCGDVLSDLWSVQQTVSMDCALPVTFGTINAFIDKKDLIVNWRTESESNNDYFDITISNNGNTFKKIGSVKSAAVDGHSTMPINYTFNTSYETARSIMLGAVFSILLFGYNKRIKFIRVIIFIGVLQAIINFNACRKDDLKPPFEETKNIFICVSQVDKDGRSTYSNVVKVVIKTNRIR